MEDQLISFKTAKLAKKAGFFVEGCKTFDTNKNSSLSIGKENNETAIDYNKRIKNIYYEIGASNFGFTVNDLVIKCTQTSLQRWLREKQNLFVEVLLDRTSNPKFAVEIYEFVEVSCFRKIEQKNWFLYRTYEEALEIGLQEALKLINKYTS